MRVFLILFSLCFSLSLRAQIDLYQFSYDTLKSDYRSLGSIGELNSSSGRFDQSFILRSNSSFYLGNEYLTSHGSRVHNLIKHTDNQYVSALPHIGFGYLFGTQGSQHLSFEYNQVFKGNWVLNSQLKNSSLEGFFRNSSFSESLSGFSLSKRTEKFGLSIMGYSSKLERQWSGGVVDDSLLDSFAPQFIPVLKPGCNSVLRSFKASISSYLRFFELNNGSLGYSNESTIHGLNRVFSEQDTLYGLYENNFFDTLTTSDQYQHSTVDHISAIYFKKDQLSYYGGVKGVYWNYRNMGMFRDTMEFYVQQKLELKKKHFGFKHSSSYNLFGALHGWHLNHEITYEMGRFNYFLKNKTGKRIPQVFQRFYNSNNNFYYNSNIELETYMEQWLGMQYTNTHFKSTLHYMYGMNRNIYFFDKTISNWSNTSFMSNNSIHQVSLGFLYSLEKFNLRQTYTYSMASQLQGVIPAHHLKGSIDYKMGLFKDKKMQLTIGLSYSLNSKTYVLPVMENIGVYDFLSIDENNVQKGIFNLGAYTAIEIDTFRFFFKINNLGYLWNDLRWNYIEHIYLPEVTLRAGLTWDFWN